MSVLFRKSFLCAGLVLICIAGQVRAEESAKKDEVATWVQDLGSDSFDRREAASKGLLKAGSSARAAVKEALKSEDAEVRRRAKELWETLRWLVVPGADEDVLALVLQCRDDKSPESEVWKGFAKKHGAPVLYFLTQLRLSGDEKNYRSGMNSVLPECNPVAMGKVVASAKDDREREALLATFQKLEVDNLGDQSAMRVAQVFNLLWMHKEAFDCSRQAWIRYRKSPLIRPCAQAMTLGRLSDQVWKEALESVPAISDPNRQAVTLAFYVALARRSGEREKVVPLVGKVVLEQKGGRLEVSSLYDLFSQLMESDFKKEAEVLAEKQEGVSLLHLRLYFVKGAEHEKTWNKLMETLGELPPEEAEGKAFTIAEQMDDWKDGKKVRLWEWILATGPNDSVYDLNVLFRFISMSEEQNRYALAGTYLAKAGEMMPKVGGVLIGASKEELLAKRDKFQKRTAWYFKAEGP